MTSALRILSRWIKRWVGLALLAGLVSQAPAGQISLSFSHNFQDVRIRDVNGYQMVELVNEPSSHGETGFPWLPVRYVQVLLPDGATPTSVQVDATEILFAKNILVYPAQPPVPLTPNAPITFYPPDKVAYSSASLFPDQSALIGHQHILRGYNLVTVALHPVRYRAADKTLFLATNMTLTVEYDENPGLRTITTPLDQNSTLFSGLVAGMVANPEALAALTETRKTTVQPLSGGSQLDYLIITSAAISNAFQQLANYRATYNGFSTRVLSTELISSTYTGVDTQAKIRNCINSLYRSNSLAYVVLGGDNTVVPDRDCKVSCGSETEAAMPTDLYYSGLDSSWDESGNGVYGEADYVSSADEGDLAFDVIVGRIPVRSEAQASAYINKMIAFESTNRPVASYYKKMIIGGVFLWTNYTGSARPTDACNDGHSEFTNHTPVSDAEIWKRRAYRDNIKPYWQASTQLGILTDTLTSWDGGVAGDFAFSAANMSSRLNQGWHFLDLFTHGNGTIWSTETGTYGTSDAAGLTGLVAVIYTEACLTGSFDTYEPSLSEAFLRNASGGSVIYMGCSRYGWGSPGSYYGGPSADYAEKFFRQLFQLHVANIGQAFAAHKAAMISSCDYNGAERWIQFGMNLQGDPGLTVALTAPSLTIVQPANNAQLKVGQSTSITVSAENGFNIITNVRFFANATYLGAAASPPYSMAWTPTNAATFALTAIADDDSGGHATSTAVSVQSVFNFSPVVAMTSPLAGALVAENTTLALAASATDPDGIVTQVVFYGDGAWLGSDSVAPYQSTWLSPASGTRSVVAVARDNEGGCATSAPVSFIVARDYFTEQFTSTNTADLAGYSLTFIPDGRSNYSACLNAIVALPTDPASATKVTLADDASSTLTLSDCSVALFGKSYTKLYINSNGNITFNSGDTTFSPAYADHFSQPRVSLFFRDLNPATAGTVSQKTWSNRVVVTFLNVPNYGETGPNTAQVEFFFTGVIRISWLALALTDGIMGLSPGGGLPSDFNPSNLNGYPSCPLEMDSDADGMPDWWEQSLFGGLTNGSPYVDSDGDGVCNLEEWICGTCPTNSASIFKASDTAPAPGFGTTISWPSLSNRLYLLEFSSNLVDGFSVLADNLEATPPLNTHTDSTHEASGTLFYQIRARMK